MRPDRIAQFHWWLLLSTISGPTLAQTAEVLRTGPTVEPRVAWTETLTNNLRLSPEPRTALVTELSPGIRIRKNSAHIKTDIDYQLDGVSYLERDGTTSRVRQNLNAFGNLELFDHWFYIDLSGKIAEQAISAFGAQHTGSGSINSNSAETSIFRVSPFIRGKLFGLSEYEIRSSQSVLRSDSALGRVVKTNENTANFHGNAPSLFRWSIEASQRQDKFDGNSANKSDREQLTLTSNPIYDFSLGASGGREANNFVSPDKVSSATSGYSIKWAPSPRLEASFGRDKRFFGPARAFDASYRTPRTVLHYHESKDIAAIPPQFSAVSLGNIYDLLYAQHADQPDPIQRGKDVETILQQYGIPANAQLTRDFFTSHVTVQRIRHLSAAWQGPRTSLTILARETQTASLTTDISTFIGASDSTEIRQRALSVTLSQRTTPNTNVNLSVATSNSEGNASNSPTTNQKSVLTGITMKMNSHTSATLSLHRSFFDNATLSYQETALACSLTVSL